MLQYVYLPEEFEYCNEPWMFSAEDQRWDDETLRQLKEEYNIIFMTSGDGVIPVMISEEWGIILGIEDDGTIQFKRRYGQPEMCFSKVWLKSLIADLQEAYKLIESGKELAGLELYQTCEKVWSYTKPARKEKSK